MSYRVTAYNARGEMLYMVPDTDAVMDKTVATVGEAFDLMESLKSAFRWDEERYFETGNGFIRNRVASFRIKQESGHEEFWTRAQVTELAIVRAERHMRIVERAHEEALEEDAARSMSATVEMAHEDALVEDDARRSVARAFPVVTAFLAESRAPK
ncbi:hypothetical protein ACFRLW_22370 [Streptomyces sp. NPDC056728]